MCNLQTLHPLYGPCCWALGTSLVSWEYLWMRKIQIIFPLILMSLYWNSINEMKTNKKYHTVGTVQNSKNTTLSKQFKTQKIPHYRNSSKLKKLPHCRNSSKLKKLPHCRNSSKLKKYHTIGTVQNSKNYHTVETVQNSKNTTLSEQFKTQIYHTVGTVQNSNYHTVGTVQNSNHTTLSEQFKTQIRKSLVLRSLSSQKH